MKKYLMGGIAAVAICAVFTSCSKNNELFDQNAAEQAKQQTSEQKIISDYQTAFENAFGKPASNQDWGLGQYGSINKAGTRATGEFANHVGAYPDANMWTSKGFLAPDPLTQSQKLRAQYYFQMNKIENPNRPNYGTKDFFVQQVYDGGTDPMTDKSAEKYMAANGSTLIESGEHMDHLTAGPDHLHIYNFNNGTCSTNGEVADRNQTHVNNTDQQHSDEIMLMLNTPTSCFGYANSDASCVRDDRWTLVSAATIDDFCDHDPGFSAWLKDRLTDERGDVKCVDDFNRDYIGFDFDMIPDDLCYAYNGYDQNGNQTWDPNQVKRKEFIYAQYGTLNEANDSRVFNEDGTVSTYASWNTEIIIDSKNIPYVVTNTNMYCAIGKDANIGIGGMDGFNDYATIGHYAEGGANDNTLYLDNLPNEQSDKKAINMKFIAKLVREGYLPVAGKDLKRWVKIGGCNDGYFSDWIVTFMPATSGDEITYQGRIMGEDLTAMSDNDFDFNDVVFDWAISADGKTAYIKLLAAGGTLPLKIGTAVGEGQEVHELFKVDKGTMVNTGVGADGITKEPVEFTITKTTGTFNSAADIIVSVDKTSKGATGYMQMTAKIGKAPCLLFVPVGTKWVDEYENIEKAYSWFGNWATTASNPQWNNVTDAKYVNLILSDNK